MTDLAPLILVGLLLGLGLRLVYSAWPTRRPVTFSERIAPQLRSAQLRSSLLEEAREESGLLNTLQRVLAPWARNLAPARVTTELFESHALRQRLIRDGNRLDIEQFRLEQLLCSAAGAAIMTLMVVLGWVGDVLAALPGVLLIMAGAAAGFVLRDHLLTRSVAARERQMLAEFPALAELMALSVTAGESATASLERVCRTSSGHLHDEFSRVLAEMRAGKPLAESLQEFAQRIGVPTLSRFVDGMTVALERGTPLADVLRSQAQDVRDEAKRDLMETAGRKEVAMMAPVVFLILPLTVVFAVFPGLAAIDIQL